MKIRNGFVSNSSSSSFVLVGYELDHSDDNIKWILENVCDKDLSKIEKGIEEIIPFCCGSKRKAKFCPECGTELEIKTREVEPDYMDLYYDEFYDLGIKFGSEDGVPEDKIVFGETIAYGLEESENDSISLDELKNMVKDKFKNLDKFDDSNLKIYWGTQCC